MDNNTFSKRKIGLEGVEELLWRTIDQGLERGPLIDWRDDSKSFMEKVQNFGTVVQAGGQCGMYPLFYSFYFERVVTFEPHPENYHCLVENCKGRNVIHYNTALSEEFGEAGLFNVSRTSVGMNQIREGAGTKLIPLDSLELSECDLIHLDIEGHEEKALKGAVETIRTFWPVVIVEAGHGGAFLETLGYRLHKKLRMDSVFIK